MVVGFSGLAQAGKDTAGEVLRRMGYKHLSFATELKAMALSLNPLLDAGGGNFVRLLTLHDHGGWEHVKSFRGSNFRGEVPPGRDFLLKLGTEICRVFGPNALSKTVEFTDRCYLTDVRRLEEAEVIGRKGGVNIFIDRPGLKPISNSPLEDGRMREYADFVVKNDGSVQDLHTAVIGCLDEWRTR